MILIKFVISVGLKIENLPKFHKSIELKFQISYHFKPQNIL